MTARERPLPLPAREFVVRELWAINGGARIEVIEWRPSAPKHSLGTPVICVHGALGSAWTWELEGEAAAAGRLGNRPRTLAALSRRGMGRSDAPVDGYGLDDFVGDLRVAVDALGYPRVALVAHSLGVPIVIAYAARHPSGVAGLVLGDYGPRYPALDDAWVKRIEDRYRSFPSWEAAYQGTMNKTGDEAHDRARFDQIKDRFLRPSATGEIVSIFSVDGIRKMRQDSRETDLADLLGRITCPVQVITGDRDDVVLTPELRGRYEHGLADVRFATIAGAGHSLVVAGRSEPFQAVVGAFVAELDSQS